jgi:hypothetical protein
MSEILLLLKIDIILSNKLLFFDGHGSKNFGILLILDAVPEHGINPIISFIIILINIIIF